MTCQDVAQKIGYRLLFLGTSSAMWSIAQFQEAAQFAKAHNIDNLLLKTADGANWWYGGINGYRAIRDAIKAEGVGCVPYTYSYGNTYGYLNGEIGVLQALLGEPDNVVVADMESEWNGQAAWASQLCKAIQGRGTFLVSTWADPALQNWMSVLSALNPCVAAYMPQQYDSYLASCWQQFGQAGAACIQPTVSIQGVGPSNPNDPVAIAKAAHDQGHTALSVWYYEAAVSNPGLLDAIFAAFPKTETEEKPTMIDISNPSVARYFKASSDGKVWQCTNGYTVGGAILDWYKAFGGSALNGLSFAGLPTSQELGLGGGRVMQRYERLIAFYDPGHTLDQPPGLDSSVQVYVAHINSGPGQDPRVTDLQAHNDDLTKQIAALQTSALAQENAALKAKISAASKDLS